VARDRAQALIALAHDNAAAAGCPSAVCAFPDPAGHVGPPIAGKGSIPERQSPVDRSSARAFAAIDRL
jgi:hypothetical protein